MTRCSTSPESLALGSIPRNRSSRSRRDGGHVSITQGGCQKFVDKFRQPFASPVEGSRCHPGPLMKRSPRSYWYFNALIGSTRDARCAGMKPAPSATSASTTPPAPARPDRHPHLEEQRLRRSAEADARRRGRRCPPTSVMRATWRSTMPRTRPRVGAQRHAHADLARALRDGVGQHAIEADRGEQRRQQRERRRERADHAVEEDVLAAPAAASS